jgi:hypothetical protein
MTNLSPAAQAIDTALADCIQLSGEIIRARPLAAAALRAAADQVVPEATEPPCGEREPWPRDYQLMRDAQWEKCQQLRAELLAIAAELEQTTANT